MTNPVLALIPSGYRTNIVYSVLPVNGDGDFTYSRYGNASRVNSGGYLETVGTDIPRLNWEGNCPSLLLEPQRTNVQRRSEEFNDATWTKTRTTVTSNQINSPDGTLSADKLECNQTTGSGMNINSSSNISSGATVVLSIFAKKGNARYCNLGLLNNGYSQYSRIFFDLQEGVSFTPQTVGTEIILLDNKIEPFANGWYRISITCQTSGNTTVRPFIYGTTGDGTFSVVNGDFNYFWGAQLEQSFFITSYIKTTSSVSTRVVDICKNGGDAELFDIKEGTFFVDVTPFKVGSNHRITLSNGTTDEEIIFYFLANNTGIAVVSEHNGLPQFTHNENITFDTRNKIALTFKNNEFKCYVNGNLVSTSLTGTISENLSDLTFAGYNGTFNYFEGKVYDTRIYNRILTETEAKELTT